ncbi:metallo-beta-lactamase [Lucifera butyrica]|uniref:Metallo-beta-lactamase n=1 Tax=Lucifera butyrica TaxID=1351585 RepID=A0A498R7C8_9FIRM|nr:MBL fold metallo-hydrolase [Lucifera butyrica]VBB07281.1 metallo-beta-lactamase [Lucifera butyrica]
MIQFIGCGSAFNTRIGNTSAFLKKGDSLLLIDCGGTVFHRLQAMQLLDGLKRLHIVITHTHPDHVGSLGDIIFYAYYVLKITPKLYFPENRLLKTFLQCIGVEKQMVEIISNLTVDAADQELGAFNLSFIPVTHVTTIPAFGFLLEYEGARIFYSGDSNSIRESVLRMLEKGELERMYQDTCGLDYDQNPHLSLRKLCEIIPVDLRSKVCCIHHDAYLDREQVKTLGFQLPDIYSM